ncbi:ATPase [uncultured Clostridium sp.]|uniref:ATPase n=1 Tax=uncultured Clostridium sp. TaxID=59620 RepID=UPI00262EC5E2|nr:ATPase [uncultured Clostridium sp.]
MENHTSVLELLEFLQDTVDRAPKVPMSGKVMVDKKEIHDTIDEIINYFPKQFKEAKWVAEQKEKIINEAKRELQGAKEETEKIKRYNIENHDLVRDAKLRANEIVGAAQREAKAIRIGSRNYSEEILGNLDKELEKKRVELIRNLQLSFEKAAKEIDDNLNGACSTIKENMKELKNFK